jgi:hypothetical protein
MKVLKPRSRMISVRLSEAEYEELCRFSATTGARSLSDLARDAMRLLVKISNHDLSPTEGLGNFQAQMDHVNRRIDELREHLMSSEQNAGRKSSRSGGSA